MASRDLGAASEQRYRRRCGAALQAPAQMPARMAIELVEDMGFGTVCWRLRSVRSAALSALGRSDDAAAEEHRALEEFRVIADRIAEPRLREWFDRQPFAPAR